MFLQAISMSFVQSPGLLELAFSSWSITGIDFDSILDRAKKCYLGEVNIL